MSGPGLRIFGRAFLTAAVALGAVLPLQAFDEQSILDSHVVKKFKCTIINRLSDAPIEVESYLTEDNLILTRFFDVKGIIVENYWLVAELYNREDKLMEKILLYNDGKHKDNEAGDRIYANTFQTRLSKGEYRVQVSLVKFTPQQQSDDE